MNKVDGKSILPRVISSVVIFLVLVVLAVFDGFVFDLGGLLWFILAAMMSFFGLFEFYRVFQIHKTVYAYIGYGITAAYYAFLYFGMSDFLFPTLVVGFMAQMAVYVLRFKKSDSIEAMASVFGILYVPVLLSFLFRTRVLEDGWVLVWLIFIGSWVADTCAWCVGILFGKHKMAKTLSPKKSWEGAIGGVVGATLLGMAYGLVLRQQFATIEATVFASGLLCGTAAVISIFGDLTASAFKRNHDIKDYSNLIPGHGGILDRFDSVMFVAPVIYYLAQLFLKGYLK